MPHPCRLFLFDLDGTLVDSREDIARAVNGTLLRMGQPALSVTEVVGFVGDGIETLMRRVLRRVAGGNPTAITSKPARICFSRSTATICSTRPTCTLMSGKRWRRSIGPNWVWSRTSPRPCRGASLPPSAWPKTSVSCSAGTACRNVSPIRPRSWKRCPVAGLCLRKRS